MLTLLTSAFSPTSNTSPMTYGVALEVCSPMMALSMPTVRPRRMLRCDSRMKSGCQCSLWYRGSSVWSLRLRSSIAVTCSCEADSALASVTASTRSWSRNTDDQNAPRASFTEAAARTCRSNGMVASCFIRLR